MGQPGKARQPARTRGACEPGPAPKVLRVAQGARWFHTPVCNGVRVPGPHLSRGGGMVDTPGVGSGGSRAVRNARQPCRFESYPRDPFAFARQTTSLLCITTLAESTTQ